VRVTIAAVGRPRDAALAAAIREYEARAAQYWPFEIVEVRGAGAADAGRAAVVEGERLLARVGRSGDMVACDPGGERMTSEEFAEWLHQYRERATSVAFVIGGAFGLSDAVRSAARRRIALAPWTLPHEIARLVLAEQIYRAGTIVRREPYHK